ncbi:hypothetical protein thsps117_09300 [Pseudomonas sp. No.117]
MLPGMWIGSLAQSARASGCVLEGDSSAKPETSYDRKEAQERSARKGYEGFVRLSDPAQEAKRNGTIGEVALSMATSRAPRAGIFARITRSE